jgi:hypothetical protein
MILRKIQSRTAFTKKKKKAKTDRKLTICKYNILSLNHNPKSKKKIILNSKLINNSEKLLIIIIV